jgi:hypothetical protein
VKFEVLRKLIPLTLLIFVSLSCSLVQRLKQEADKAGKPTVLTSPDGKYQLTVPGDWRADAELHKEAIIQASNRLSEMYVIVLSDSKEDFADDMTLLRFTNLTRDNMKGNIISPEITDPIATGIGGHPALEYELRGTVGGVKVAYINTTVETATHYHQVLTWTLPSRFDKNQATLREVTRSFKEVAGTAPQAAEPPPPPAPAESKSGKQQY